MPRLAIIATLALASFGLATPVRAADDIVIAHVTGFTGPLSPYAEQLQIGMEMGFEYATDGRMSVAGRNIRLLKKDTRMNPVRARTLVAEAYTEDGADIVVGPVSSGVALATLPLAARFRRIIMPEGVADAITGERWNRYVVRVARNSSQDAISNAVAIGKPGVCVATLAQDYAFGRNGVAAYKKAMLAQGGKLVHEEYLARNTTDFTAAALRLFQAFKGREDCTEGKYIFAIWAGAANPLAGISALHPERFDIQLATGGNILAGLVGYADYPGLEGATYYYFELPDNEVNDWFVAQHRKRYSTPPDMFGAQGFSQAMAIVAALRKTGGSSDPDELIKAFEGLTFDSPKGQQVIRAQDHQTLQVMYHFRIQTQQRDDWFKGRTVRAGVPVRVDTIGINAMDIPVKNER